MSTRHVYDQLSDDLDRRDRRRMSLCTQQQDGVGFAALFARV